MPELPEVETVARQLAQDLCGQKISKCIVKDPKLKLPQRELIGQTIIKVHRLGKKVVFTLKKKGATQLFLAVHLRMTGRLLYVSADERAAYDSHERMRLNLTSGKLRFSDVRRFGTVECTADLDALTPTAVDPLRDRLSLKLLNQLIGDSPQNVKAWLLRQDRFVGLGNIYASEILYQAGIDPQRIVSSLNAEERRALMQSTKNIIRSAVRACGTTISDFQDSRGELGSYQRFLKVYGQAGEPCPKCSKPLLRLIQQQRSTFYCPQCQV